MASRSSSRFIVRLRCLLALLCLQCAPATAASLDFTLITNEPVVVTGTPRIAIDVGGVTRYATYASMSGTRSLAFSYAVQAGDLDADGITLASPLDLTNGGITDAAGNPMAPLSFILPDTSGLKVQTYTASFTSTTNSAALSFAIAKAPSGASFSYTISSSGGTGTVIGSGTISGSPHTVSGVDVSALAAGTLTLSVTVSNASGTGAARTATATPSLIGALDSLPAAQLMVSLRRLRAAHTSPLLRVRRSSDNAERDITATLDGNLDTTTLTAFCASDSCFVPIWYDQSGNGLDVGTVTAQNQPRIVNAGNVELEGGKPALKYTSALQAITTTGTLPVQLLNATWNAVARLADNSVNRHVMGDRCSGATGRVLRAVAGGASYVGFNTGGASVTLSGSTMQQRIVTLLSGTSGMSGALDGSFTNGGTSSFYTMPTCRFVISGGGTGQGSGDWIGTISEVTLFTFTMGTSDRQTLERNQGSYFGISVP